VLPKYRHAHQRSSMIFPLPVEGKPIAFVLVKDSAEGCRSVLDGGDVSSKPPAKPPYRPVELKKLSPKAALEWLESKSSSSDRATSKQIEELKQYVRSLIPEENGE
jgi:hypothetical protein